MKKIQKTSDENIKDTFYAVTSPLFHIQSLIEIAQDAFLDKDMDNVYNLLSVLDEKIEEALDILNKNESCFEKEGNT